MGDNSIFCRGGGGGVGGAQVTLSVGGTLVLICSWHLFKMFEGIWQFIHF